MEGKKYERVFSATGAFCQSVNIQVFAGFVLKFTYQNQCWQCEFFSYFYIIPVSLILKTLIEFKF